MYDYYMLGVISMSNKLVSVCINSYNSAKYILDTINSVINQTYKNLQIIVLDDCSTDNTIELVKSIDDPRIEIHSTYKNSFYTFAYNESLKYIKGDYVARLDADDLWEKDKIKKQVEFLDNNQTYGACFTHVQVIDENGNTDDEKLHSLKKVFDFDNCSQEEMYRKFYEHSNRLCHSSSLIRTELMKTVGEYDVSTFNVNDFDYWMRLITYSPIYIITEPLTLYRSGGASSDNSEERWVAHNTELVRVIYKSINMCPDDLFLKAFPDKLRLKGEHTHEETEIEKALLLLEGPLTYIGNPVLGIYKFVELFKQEKYIILAESKFNFTTKDLYKIQCTPCYFDIGNKTHLVNSLNNTNLELSNCKEYISSLEKHNKNIEKYNENLKKFNDSLNENNQKQSNYIKQLERTLDSTSTQLNELNTAYNKLRNNFFVRVLLFAKRLFIKE